MATKKPPTRADMLARRNKPADASAAAAAEVAGVAAPVMERTLGPDPSDKVTTGNARDASADTPHPAPPHPCAVGLDFARTLPQDEAPAWLAKNYPQHFASPEEARAALTG